ncbi:MAG: hypothetical protein P8L39_00185, partial [Halioglobus sp.]|nr:hypothetical protein [Halioglobus sp.]
LIDKTAEISRLDREIRKLQSDISRLVNKLGNQSFVDKAPPAVVAKEQEKLQSQQHALETLEKQRQKIQQF